MSPRLSLPTQDAMLEYIKAVGEELDAAAVPREGRYFYPPMDPDWICMVYELRAYFDEWYKPKPCGLDLPEET